MEPKTKTGHQVKQLLEGTTGIRLVSFGLNNRGVQLSMAPTTWEGCGFYVHVDDIDKYRAWEASFTDSNHESKGEK